MSENNSKKWYESEGERSDVVISTRIRLARNLNGYPFPHLMNPEQRKEVCQKVRDALVGGNSALRDSFRYIEAEKLSQVELVSLAGRHLISPEFATHPEGRALLLMEDESVCIMINEEDHVRIQVMGSGMQLGKAYDLADKIDTLLDETLHFAFDEELGYLTACPTNLGTGMRASVMLHLPAIESDGTLRRVASGLGKIGAVIRGSYGEGSESTGAMYQISNQVTLGISEKDTLSNLSQMTERLIELEKKARAALLENESFLDSVWRALGLMKSARAMTSAEFIGLYSTLRVGVAEGIVKGMTLGRLAEVYESVQPASLMERFGENLTAAQRDKKRAEILREAFKSTDIA